MFADFALKHPLLAARDTSNAKAIDKADNQRVISKEQCKSQLARR